MTERGEESGLAVLCAGLGGGKSTAGGNIIYRSLMQGIPWTVLDPSGRLTALCRLPDLAGRAEAIDLLEAPPGVLNTYRVIAEPVFEHYDSELEWKVAKEHAAETRRMLTSNVLRSMLPRQMQDHVLTEVALLRAVGKVHATHTSSTTYVVEELASLDGDPELCRHAGYMADFLREAAKTSHGRLIFPSGYYLDKHAETPLLTVYSLRGLALPDESTPYSDDLDERLSMCVLYLAAWLTQRAMYSGDVHGRKGIFLDEAWALSTFGSGRRFIDRASRDSRKHNTRVLLASQNPSDLLKLDLANLVSAAFIGRLTDEQAQRDALRFLPGVPEGVGYEAIFGTHARGSAELASSCSAMEPEPSSGSGWTCRPTLTSWKPSARRPTRRRPATASPVRKRRRPPDRLLCRSQTSHASTRSRRVRDGCAAAPDSRKQHFAVVGRLPPCRRLPGFGRAHDSRCPGLQRRPGGTASGRWPHGVS